MLLGDEAREGAAQRIEGAALLQQPLQVGLQPCVFEAATTCTYAATCATCVLRRRVPVLLALEG